MNSAVCINCGSFKSGALTACPQCAFTPVLEDELLRSLAMSERYFGRGDLEAMGARIASDLPVTLDTRLFEILKAAFKQLQSAPSPADTDSTALAPEFDIKPRWPD